MKHWISPDIKYKTFMKNKNCKKEFGSCQCPDCIIPVRNNLSKTWQKRFEEEFWGKFGSTKTINEIKQFISQAIDQTREETIREIKNYQHGFIRDDGFGEPERAPEWQVVEDLLKSLINK